MGRVEPRSRHLRSGTRDSPSSTSRDREPAGVSAPHSQSTRGTYPAADRTIRKCRQAMGNGWDLRRTSEASVRPQVCRAGGLAPGSWGRTGVPGQKLRASRAPTGHIGAQPGQREPRRGLTTPRLDDWPAQSRPQSGWEKRSTKPVRVQTGRDPGDGLGWRPAVVWSGQLDGVSQPFATPRCRYCVPSGPVVVKS